ncbi:DUF3995 domain-containing protein [Yinghuangia soli]|uniref:DUF3995 domain-containing protein n=1 Tax=Yinghuangia soli TaxID=2908204 RepID=A0AA41Q5M6_9ACTN|nr:DUF3995 domain-containing protein [Yinghuangia soli]MCF2531998.1 DUF3995 domain-containing protein [Yinghuangia soli]
MVDVFAPLAAATARRLGTAVAALLTADAVLHAFWATGATWPAETTEGLSYGLLNADVPFTPPILLPLCAVLGTAALGVFAYSRSLGGPFVRSAARLATAGVAAGMTVRALAGVGWAFGIGADSDTTFYWLNLALYTPVCVGFGYAAARLAAAGGRRGVTPSPSHGSAPGTVHGTAPRSTHGSARGVMPARATGQEA